MIKRVKSLVGNNIISSPFVWAKLKILRGEWILDQNGFGNTQHANTPLNSPYTTESNQGPKRMAINWIHRNLPEICGNCVTQWNKEIKVFSTSWLGWILLSIVNTERKYILIFVANNHAALFLRSFAQVLYLQLVFDKIFHNTLKAKFRDFPLVPI